ncbi:Reaction center protein H chain [Rhodovastum atsumiense]|uniref:Photosynthetic reaction center subunit H n=1 Tax=Rhodovastum atsumiense TaxID=504468 RepID=A0A5M6IX83_9PROT|nr:photosynthetic reaction center subunit H [Rhodovastum atsumiense]KAA5612902.1 photosynthetic reaction center subunit H [Rhodovastum atsumiense]CAH2601016.1 Reaction center protein H chain [Rhodovastum atsumiense]
MQTGAITAYFDVAQLTLWAFILFFAGLVVYLRREDKREGYPLLAEGGETTHGLFPATPEPKTYLLQDGSTLTLPRAEKARTLALSKTDPAEGAPAVPTGDPLRDAVGPASYADRADEPDTTWEGEPRLVPLRAAPEFSLDPEDPDPRGYPVVATDGVVAGKITEAWVDRAEPQVYYYDVKLNDGRTVILPARLAVVDDTAQRVTVASITAAQFAGVPAIKNPDVITLLEEDKIAGYYAGGHLYAVPARQEPLA